MIDKCNSKASSFKLKFNQGKKCSKNCRRNLKNNWLTYFIIKTNFYTNLINKITAL